MKNYVQNGANVTITAGAAYSSGDPVVVGDLVGVAVTDIANGATGQLHFAFEGGVPAAVEDLAGMNGFDFKFRMHGRAPVPKRQGQKWYPPDREIWSPAAAIAHQKVRFHLQSLVFGEQHAKRVAGFVRHLSNRAGFGQQGDTSGARDAINWRQQGVQHLGLSIPAGTGLINHRLNQWLQCFL